MNAKLVFDNGETMTVEEDGQIVGSDRRIRGAIRFNRQGQKVDAYFTREVTTRPDDIPWKFQDGTQRTRLYDDADLLEGSYVVVSDEGTSSRPTIE
jgi:hypothetical protein